MQVEEFKELRLVGGTSLALQMGHRNSVDIDLFGKYADETDFMTIISRLSTNFNWIKKSKNINIFEIESTKVDFVNYTYPWLENEIIEKKIRLAGIRDIAAMKINAITGRGAIKDFIDLYFILKKYTLADILKFYQDKYFDNDMIIALKSLTYFNDAEKESMPEMFIPIEWTTVKAKIKTEVERYIKSLK